MPVQEKNLDTYALYNDDAVKFIRQFTRESDRNDLFDMAYEERAAAATRWFLDSHGRWSKAHIRRTAAALTQWVTLLGEVELIPNDKSRTLLQALKDERPRSKRRNRRLAKSIKLAELRQLIFFFRKDKSDSLSTWIAGYLQLASRIGWRPGEMVSVWLDGNYLCSLAEKNTNERGLCGICEIALHEYPPRLIKILETWILETERLANEHGGRWNLRDLVKKRISRACADLGIRPISLYTLRHFAIACMKKSGFSPEEIAVIINHASTRTATERYGKARTGRKRAKKMVRVDPWRLGLVRKTARAHGRKRAPTVLH